MLNALAAPIRAGRGVAAAKGDLRSLGLDQAAAGAIAARGRDVSLQIPDLDTESFTAAAYDIRSGIEGLSTEGIAGLTEASAVTARATKGDVANKTGLVGSIPAHAGEPICHQTTMTLVQVYPRTCGGTAPMIRSFPSP